MSSNARLLAPVALGGLVVALTATLNGCAAVSDAMLHRTEGRWSTYAAAAKAWPEGSIPSWIPDDATEVRAVAADDDSAAVIRFRTATALPDSCTTADRRSVPFLTRDWIPKAARTSDDLVDCGEFQVVAVAHGYVGWFVQGEGPDDGTPTPASGR